MRQYKWKKSLCMFLALLMLFSTFSTPQATFSADNVDVIENAVEEYVKSWFFENFSEHYILSDYSSSVSELTITGDEILATVPLGAYTTLKYTSVDSLPYMLGIKEKLNKNFNASGGDCANYVSQCLKAAGLGTTSNWYYNNNGSICTDSTHDARVGHTCTNTHICGEAWRKSTELRKELSS